MTMMYPSNSQSKRFRFPKKLQLQRSSNKLSLDTIFKVVVTCSALLYLHFIFKYVQSPHHHSPDFDSSADDTSQLAEKAATARKKSIATSIATTAEVSSESSELSAESKPKQTASASASAIRIQTTNHQNLRLPRILALVFPQFHQDSINDNLWGEGFTDWDNLRKAPKKNRAGFDIPHPTELGFYDYTHLEPRLKQGQLAKEYNIDGFIYHHYWFYDESHPGPNLHKPLEAMLEDGHPDTPFALDWVAVKWDNTWNGKVRSDFVFKELNVLQKQYFPAGDDESIQEHYNFLRKFFHHPNYIKVDGQPLFMVYCKKPGEFPILTKLRELAKADGFPNLYFILGFARPHMHLQSQVIEEGLEQFKVPKKKHLGWNGWNRTVAYPSPSKWNENRTMEIPDWCDRYVLEKDKAEPIKRTNEIPGIPTSFDNTPRRNYEEAYLWSAHDPSIVLERFRHSLYAATYYETCCFQHDESSSSSGAKEEKNIDGDDKFILLNAMNEWAEGMVMEPSDVYGRGFLETVKDIKDKIATDGCNWVKQ